MTSALSIRGVWAASVTPLTASLDVDHPRFAAHVRWLLDRGCDGVCVFGSTGEANSFSVDERVAALDALLETGIPAQRLIVGAGACAYPDARVLAEHAAAAGCAAVLVTPPFYYKNVSADGIFSFLDRLGPVRIVLYHYPRLVGVGYEESLVERLYGRLDIAGIKDSSGDLDRMRRLAGGSPGLSVLAGNESLLLDLLESGGAGCLTASANLTSALAARVMETRDAALQEQLSAVRAALQSAPFVPGLKQVLADHFGDPAWLHIRPPLEPLAAGSARDFLAGLPALPNLGA